MTKTSKWVGNILAIIVVTLMMVCMNYAITTNTYAATDEDHSWDDGTITTAATCSQTGVITYTCTTCSATKEETVVIDASNHTNTTIINASESTCTAAGYTGDTYCEDCKTTIATGSTIALASHEYTSKITKVATCTAAGVRTYTCTACGGTYTESIAAVGHGTTTSSTSTTKATTSKAGKKVVTYTCDSCGEVVSTTTTTIAKISSATLSTTSYTYSGSAKKPSVTVKDSNGNKISSSYYTVTYTNNKSVGTATVTIKFKSNYSGTITKTFKIKPKGTSISKTSKTKNSITVTWSKQSTKMSSSRITGYQIQYSTSSSFTSSTTKTLTVKGYSSTSKKITSLKSGKTYYIRIRTYKTINGTKYYSSWSTVKSTKTASNSSSSSSSLSSSTTVYITPTGSKYHLLSTCGGKNAYATTYAKATSAGKTACSKCAS